MIHKLKFIIKLLLLYTTFEVLPYKIPVQLITSSGSATFINFLSFTGIIFKKFKFSNKSKFQVNLLAKLKNNKTQVFFPIQFQIWL
jgi:hypothetical protein